MSPRTLAVSLESLWYSLSVKVWLRFLLVPVLGIISLASAFVSSYQLGVFRIQSDDVTITVTNKNPYFEGLASRLNPALKNALGKNLWEVDVSALADRIQNERWVETVFIRRDFPNRLKIEVTPKEVAAFYMSPKGDFFPIAAAGDFLPVAKFNQSWDRPILRDVKFAKNPDLRLKALGLLSEIPETGNLSRATVAEMSVGRDGEIWLMLLKNKIRVKLGQENIPTKAERVSRVLDYLEFHNVDGRVIDADFNKKVLVRPRNRR